ncbi:MAG: histidine phosphatase family protein [Leptospirales bacterium]|nr:histidine phosphatase family protein [Leptospirales bacterium]
MNLTAKDQNPRIICVRHGKPTVRYGRSLWQWTAAAELNALFDAYDRAGLEADWNRRRLPGKISAYALSSDLPRAMQTAELYSGVNADGIESSALLREAPLARLPMRWRGPLAAMLAVSRFGWYSGWLRCTETRRQTLLRARHAADLVVARVIEQGEVAVYSHGFFLWLLGAELRRRGWDSPKRGRYRYLEQAEFRPRAGEEGLALKVRESRLQRRRSVADGKSTAP